MKLTIIIPAYNEEEGIYKTLTELIPLAQKRNWKILVIDDGSTDKTRDEVLKVKDVKLISHPYNKGYGASLKTGIKESDTEYIAFYDADGQHNPQDLENLFNNLSGYDMFIGKRGKDSYNDWLRKPGKWLLSKVANYLSGRKIPDLNSGLRVIKREIIKKHLNLFPNGFSFSTTSTLAFMNLGYNVGYIPIQVKKRVGKSSVNQVRHGASTILLILRLIVLFNPMKVFLPISGVLFIMGAVYEIIFGMIQMFPNMRLIPVAFFSILTSIIIFFFGLVVDQISEMRKNQSIE